MILALTALGLLGCCFGNVDVTCKYKIPGGEASEHHCYIDELPPSNSTQDDFNFLVKYADPSVIEKVRLAATVEYVPKQMFTTFPNLHTLDMFSANLKELNRGDFAQAVNLRSMDLHDNKLKVIKRNVFSPMATMTDLSDPSNEILKNPINSVYPLNVLIVMMFSGNEMANVETNPSHSIDLRLQNNRMTLKFSPTANGVDSSVQSNEIRKDSVVALQKLFKLILARNEISAIEANAFNGLNDLFDLQLQYNELTAIHRLTFAGMPSLRYLDLDGNQIATIEDGAFDLPELIRLSITTNKLKTLSDIVFDGVPKLTIIRLYGNHLERIGRSLYGLMHAKHISLIDNSIQDIDLAAFAKMPYLKELELVSSGFTFGTTRIEDDQHWNSPLKMLLINENGLTDATELNKLRVFPNLRYLYLGDNAYSNLVLGDNKTLKDILPSLKTLFLCGMRTSNENRAAMWQQLQAMNMNFTNDCTKYVNADD